MSKSDTVCRLPVEYLLLRNVRSYCFSQNTGVWNRVSIHTERCSAGCMVAGCFAFPLAANQLTSCAYRSLSLQTHFRGYKSALFADVQLFPLAAYHKAAWLNICLDLSTVKWSWSTLHRRDGSERPFTASYGCQSNVPEWRFDESYFWERL